MKIKPKHHNIRIFKEIETHHGTIKEYIHSKNSFLKANVRQLSANEQAVAGAIHDSSDIEFTINRRNISVDMFVEFKRFGVERVYQMSGVDNFKFFNTDITFRAYEINPKQYLEVRWSNV